MKKPTEGRRLWFSVMAIFATYAAVFILFEDYDRKTYYMPLTERSDWHLLLFSLVVLFGLGWLLYGYARRMDERISRRQEERRSQMRREMTQNISHELKTPVSSILGYTDTILSSGEAMPAATQRQFLERTHAQALRLSHLLQDLSTLNKMDYATDLQQHERVDVYALVADIQLETEIAFSQQGMTLRNCLPRDISICGNSHLLYSIFRNLVDNALSYAGRGSTVTLSAVRRAGDWFFTFSDDGVGVPEEHLPRLFERFYRLDKGRSRALGGTGLGLSIVKNAVLFHGGTIRASQNTPHGLRFDFTLHNL